MIKKCPKCDYWQNANDKIRSLRVRLGAACNERDKTVKENKSLLDSHAALAELLGTDEPGEMIERVKMLKDNYDEISELLKTDDSNKIIVALRAMICSAKTITFVMNQLDPPNSANIDTTEAQAEDKGE